MHATICPTVTATTDKEFRSQIEKVTAFATRVHIDLADGSFSPSKLIAIDKVWWPGGVRADLHLMYRNPMEHLAAIVALRPQLAIVHAESDGNFAVFSQIMREHGIEVGVALLPKTSVDTIKDGLSMIDHVLIFSGDLGYFGGAVDLNLLEKAKQLKTLKPQLEIGWDGGVSDQNARALAEGGIDVLNTGGYIHKSTNSHEAYESLERAVIQD